MSKEKLNKPKPNEIFSIVAQSESYCFWDTNVIDVPIENHHSTWQQVKRWKTTKEEEIRNIEHSLFGFLDLRSPTSQSS